ncbi:MAG: class I SAM-dependent methyltransferase [Candidatus Marinimicrobia bacterium]|nr:class I SAM-dependent methyltransferase [Candidatus Neomarinimicrobiota bacterium]
MDKEQKKYLRGILFRHLDGLAIAPTVSALEEGGINTFIKNNPEFTFTQILENFELNPGYMNVALRLLASQGWLERNIIADGESIDFILTIKGIKALEFSHYYKKFSKFIPILVDMDKFLFDPNAESVQEQFTGLIEDWRSFHSSYTDKESIGWETACHLEGLIAGPLLVALGMSEFFRDCLNNDGIIERELIEPPLPMLSSVLDFFMHLGWISSKEHEISFTETGIFFMKRATAYGVTVSYLPTFKLVPALLFGNPNILWKRTSEGLETHVNRRMNVWGSGGAHSLYFRKIDEIIKDIFNKPLEDQPVGIADMGCGDGTLLKHLYQVVKNHTERGKYLQELPLKIIGADFNKAARLASSITLREAGIEHSILHGDITGPEEYAENLKQQFGLHLDNMLNVRSFLDHNRIYSPPKKVFADRICNSTGAFAFRGRWIPNNELQENLVEHFSSWTQYVSKFGLLILELHTIDPKITAENLGNTLSTAYDGTHGYSDQYIMEIDTVLNSAREAGLFPVMEYQAKFPDNELATISINLFKPKH